MTKPFQLRHVKATRIKKTFTKVNKANAVNLVQSPTGHSMLEHWYCCLGHLIDVHMLKNLMSGMNLREFACLIPLLFCEICIADKNYKVAYLNKGGCEQPSLWRLCIPMCVAHEDHIHIDVLHHFIREKLKTKRYVWNIVQQEIWKLMC